MRGRFLLYAISPILYNVGIIIGILVLYPTFGIAGLSWGVVIGAFMHLIIQLPFLVEHKILPNITFKIDWVLIKNIVKVSVPRTIALSINSITGLVLASFASLIGEGSIAVYALAFNLQSVPLSIIGASYSSAAFPALSKLFAKGDMDGFINEVVTVSKYVIFWGISASVLFVLLREEIVQTILGTGSFGLTDVARAAVVLSAFAISIVPQSLTTVFMRVFYAKGETARPLMLNIFSAVATVGFAYYGYKYMAWSGVVSLAIAYSLGSFINMFLHVYSLRSDNVLFTKGFIWTTIQTSLAWLFGGIAICVTRAQIQFVFDQGTTLSVFLQGLSLGVIAMLISGITLYLLKNDELLHISEAFKKRLASFKQ
jgi:putative peptidoglycan lipid II flippase